LRSAISVRRLGKRFRIASAPRGLYGTLGHWFERLASRTKVHAEERNTTFWALRDVNFEVASGEVVGLVGANGAGKSTMLKILSRITAPTEGRAMIQGRVGSLLEVGTGFHQELTGRENVFLNGAILGMTRQEIRAKFDEIVDFSGVEEFLDTPVKRYSSGMRVRLAFAVAAHLHPEVLLIDEVLAVGDARFQKKCLDKMSDVAHGGRTVMFVSHNMVAVKNICDRVIWLDRGRIRQEGSPSELIREYLSDQLPQVNETDWPDYEQAPGNEFVRIRRIHAYAVGGSDTELLSIHQPIDLVFDYWINQPDANVNLSVSLLSEDGAVAFSTTTETDPNWHGKPFPRGLYRSRCHIPANLLNDCEYGIRLFVVENEGVVRYKHDSIARFNVHETLSRQGSWHGKWPGVVRPRIEWETERLDETYDV